MNGLANFQIRMAQGYLEMGGVCFGLWFTELASGQGNHLQLRALKKNLQMSYDPKYEIDWIFIVLKVKYGYFILASFNSI